MRDEPQIGIDAIHLNLFRFSHRAMATKFEIITIHKDESYARQAAWAAFDEVDHLECELSRFIENSDISRINQVEQGKNLPISQGTYECLQLGVLMREETYGAFDISLGSGLEKLKLDPKKYSVQRTAESLWLDLGGIGKGYAVDRIAEVIKDWGLDVALIHGGFSSVLALGGPREISGWPLTLSAPDFLKEPIVRINVKSGVLSSSGLMKGHHIIDPKTRKPVDDKYASWVFLPAADHKNKREGTPEAITEERFPAARADALSTAFMVLSPAKIENYCRTHAETCAMIAMKQDGAVLRYGPWEFEESDD